jgi:uncharacterized protein
LANPVPEEAFKKAFEKANGHISLQAFVTLDRLKMFVDCQRLGGEEDHKPVSKDELLEMLNPAHGPFLHQDILESIVHDLNARQEVKHRRIARGHPAVDGKDGWLELLVKKYQPMKKDTPIEFRTPRSIHFFDNVERNSTVGRLHHPQEGVDGVDVLGQPVKAKTGKPLRVLVDKSLHILEPGAGENYQQIVAQVAGYLFEEAGKLSVREQMVIEGDVGFKTGDIDFVGSLVVEGNVLKDFKVKARQDVEVKGNAIHCSVSSSLGHVTIRGSAYGAEAVKQSAHDHAARSADYPGESSRRAHPALLPGGALFRAGGEFIATTVQSTSVEADGTIGILNEASNALLRTKRAVLLPQGHLFGGAAYVVEGVEAKVIGTKLGSSTEIYFCTNVESSSEYPAVLNQIEAQHTAQALFKLHLGPFAEHPELMEKLQEQQRARIRALYEKYVQVQESLSELERQREILVKCAKFNQTLRVSFHEMLYRGTVIACGEKLFEPENDIPGPKTVEFLTSTHSFVVTDYKPVQVDAPQEEAKPAEPPPKSPKPKKG